MTTKSNIVYVQVMGTNQGTVTSASDSLSSAQKTAYGIAEYILNNGIGSVNNNNFVDIAQQIGSQYGISVVKSTYGDYVGNSTYAIAETYNSNGSIIGADVYTVSIGNVGSGIVYNAFVSGTGIQTRTWGV